MKFGKEARGSGLRTLKSMQCKRQRAWRVSNWIAVIFKMGLTVLVSCFIPMESTFRKAIQVWGMVRQGFARTLNMEFKHYIAREIAFASRTRNVLIQKFWRDKKMWKRSLLPKNHVWYLPPRHQAATGWKLACFDYLDIMSCIFTTS